MKWNEWGFRPPLCTCRLNWARRTSWGFWNEWDDTTLQTQDSKVSVTEAPQNIASSRVSGEETFCFFDCSMVRIDIAACKSKWHYLPTLQVSSYCLSTSHSSNRDILFLLYRLQWERVRPAWAVRDGSQLPPLIYCVTLNDHFICWSVVVSGRGVDTSLPAGSLLIGTASQILDTLESGKWSEPRRHNY